MTGKPPRVTDRDAGLTCRPCEIAGYLTEDGWPGLSGKWHARCKRHGCGCDHGKGAATSMREPHFGHTKHGLPVHLHAHDHLPEHNAYARLNKTVALAVTHWVGSMSCAWAFCLLALLSLPAVLTQALHVHWFPSWLVAVGLIALVAWIAQTFLQLVLLSVIMVGQNVQQAASDARAAKTFEDTESANASLDVALDRLDVTTEGGIKAILDAVNGLAAQTAPAKRLATPAERSEGSGT